MIYETNELIPAQSIEAITSTYADAKARIKAACDEIAAQTKRINETFGKKSYIRLETRHLNFDNPESELREMDRFAWRVILDRSGVIRIMSVKAVKDVDNQLNNTRENLPPIDFESVKATLEAHRSKAYDYLRAAVVEVHNWLRPHSHYKTNSEYDIGEKVILTYALSFGYGRHIYRVNYHRDQEFRALDNVFALLDSKPGITTHHGPLADAINTCEEGTGETEYFRFRCFKNQNLHLQFKRMDLVAKLNAIAGGNALYATTGGAK
jgi:hypothetical protein